MRLRNITTSDRVTDWPDYTEIIELLFLLLLFLQSVKIKRQNQA